MSDDERTLFLASEAKTNVVPLPGQEESDELRLIKYAIAAFFADKYPHGPIQNRGHAEAILIRAGATTLKPQAPDKPAS